MSKFKDYHAYQHNLKQIKAFDKHIPNAKFMRESLKTLNFSRKVEKLVKQHNPRLDNLKLSFKRKNDEIFFSFYNLEISINKNKRHYFNIYLNGRKLSADSLEILNTDLRKSFDRLCDIFKVINHPLDFFQYNTESVDNENTEKPSLFLKLESNVMYGASIYNAPFEYSYSSSFVFISRSRYGGYNERVEYH